MTAYLAEFAAVMAVFAVTIVIPGADFVMVVRQSLTHGRRTAIITSFGIGVSILFHISYTILGLGLIISQSLLLFSLLKWVGAAYLLYLGISALRSPDFRMPEINSSAQERRPVSGVKAFLMGFVTNALNPKPVLFFLSIFSALVSHETPAAVQGLYGVGMSTALIAWFVGVSFFLTTASMRARFLRAGRWINRISGAIFVALSLKLAAEQAP